MQTPQKQCLVCQKVFFNLRFNKLGQRIRKWTKEQWERAKFCSHECRAKSMEGMPSPRLGMTKEHVTYNGLHKWVYRTFGKYPKECLNCGILGELKNNRWTIEYANKSGMYQRIKEDWLMLCTKCHRKHDKQLRNTQERG